MTIKEVLHSEVYQIPVEPSEQEKHLHSLAQLKQATIAFQDDRPTLGIFHDVEPSHTLWLAYHEISELNGLDKYGYFAHENKLSEYRQQELADIIIFLQDIYNQLTDNDYYVFADEAKINSMAQEIAAQYGITPVGKDKSLENVITFNEQQEAVYMELRGKLNAAAEVINPDNYEAWAVLPAEQQEHVLNTIMAHSYVMMYLLGLNPIRASLEKIARNILRYEPALLQDDFSDIFARKDLDDDEREKLIIKRYTQAVDACKKQFDGPKDKTGERPQYGTVSFYDGPNSQALIKLVAAAQNHDKVEEDVLVGSNQHNPVTIYD